MTAQFARTPYRGRSGGSTTAEPHAALLIDFDNVTMGIRSDLTKELKNLLNSDIIKGKVAVQRAYADWRRYPQYIVPLAESSVDLIFAPAYGSAKKNATDIRLAIDALELVFTRSEIGTFILLSGDSDFSSLVLKLKEYGKYVIGVGIRESASDLLVQNCDEYYSYSALTGLTRAGEEAPAVSEDPWELVEMALRQMIDNDDVMRSDRLKQVLLELDPTFDEKSLGFPKFNKFLQEAASRGILSLRKQDNGQFEVGPPSAEPEAQEALEEAAAEARESRRSRSRRGRGRREERKEVEAEEATPPAEPEVKAPVASKAAQPAAKASAEPAAAKRPAAKAVDGAGETVPESADLAAAYDLLRRATADLVRRNGQSVRDSDVKRRILELSPGWDETSLGFSKFSRFLRQAHDADVITLRKTDGGNYDVMLGPGEAEPVEEESTGRGRGRKRGAAAEREPQKAAGRAAADGKATAPAKEPAEAPAVAAEAAKPSQAAAATAPATQPTPVRPVPAPIGFRRGSRGRTVASGPPPLLEGQTARVATSAQPAPAAEESRQQEEAAARGGRRKTAARKTAPEAVNLAQLGLPREAGEIASYVVANYKGVGPKSVQTLIEKFGATRVFDALENRPDDVRAAIGAARGDRLIAAWKADLAARTASTPEAAAEAKTTDRPAAKKRTRRGGRNRRGQTART